IRCLAAIALGVLPTQAGAQSPPAPEVLRVTRSTAGDGEGSLRWAIERNNAAPGRLRIEPDPAGQAPPPTKPASPARAGRGAVRAAGDCAALARRGRVAGAHGRGGRGAPPGAGGAAGRPHRR